MVPHKAGPHKVAHLVVDNVSFFDVSFAPRFLGHRSLLDGWPGATSGTPPYEVMTCTVDDKPVRTSAGIMLVPTHPRSVLAEADTVIIPGPTDSSVFYDGVLPDDIRAAFDLVPPGARWVSVCTAAFFLAAYGMLDGRTATTHWVHGDDFRQQFPHVDFTNEVLYVDHGNILMSAGNAAGIDLMLHIIRKDLGERVANRVARGAVLSAWREGGQAQFVDTPVPVESDNSGTALARSYVLEHLGDADLSIRVLASAASMSVRTFTRRFRAETGVSPTEWVTGRRIARARELLESTDMPIDRIAEVAGFGTGASLRAHFRSAVGVSPSAFRSSNRARELSA